MATRDFTATPLYKKLVEVLPAFTRNPFNDDASLDVLRLKVACQKSHEAVYKWLRTSRLSAKNVELLVCVAGSPENLKALQNMGRTAPTREDFLPFIFNA